MDVGVRGQLEKLVLSFDHVDLENASQVIRLGNGCLCLLRPLIGPCLKEVLVSESFWFPKIK